MKASRVSAAGVCAAVLTVGVMTAGAPAAQAETAPVVFTATSDEFEYVVPEGVTAVNVTVQGAGGGSAGGSGAFYMEDGVTPRAYDGNGGGGSGAVASCQYGGLTGGEVLTIYVGAGGEGGAAGETVDGDYQSEIEGTSGAEGDPTSVYMKDSDGDTLEDSDMAGVGWGGLVVGAGGAGGGLDDTRCGETELSRLAGNAGGAGGKASGGTVPGWPTIGGPGGAGGVPPANDVITANCTAGAGAGGTAPDSAKLGEPGSGNVNGVAGNAGNGGCVVLTFP